MYDSVMAWLRSVHKDVAFGVAKYNILFVDVYTDLISRRPDWKGSVRPQSCTCIQCM